MNRKLLHFQSPVEAANFAAGSAGKSSINRSMKSQIAAFRSGKFQVAAFLSLKQEKKVEVSQLPRKGAAIFSCCDFESQRFRGFEMVALPGR